MFHKTVIVGRLGSNPETRHTPAGKTVANFSVAAEGFGQTEWYRVVCWEKQAEFADKYLRKGGLVLIEGRMATRSWEDKEGTKRYSTELIADRVLGLQKMVGDDEVATDSDEQDDDDQPF